MFTTDADGAIVVVCWTAACWVDQLTSAGLKRAKDGDGGRRGCGAMVGSLKVFVALRLRSTALFIVAALVLVVVFSNSAGNRNCNRDVIGRFGCCSTFDFCELGVSDVVAPIGLLSIVVCTTGVLSVSLAWRESTNNNFVAVGGLITTDLTTLRGLSLGAIRWFSLAGKCGDNGDVSGDVSLLIASSASNA